MLEDFINKVICGEAIEEMKKLPDDCVDSVITDPPYGIGFMGKEWDNFKPLKIDEAMEKDKRKHTQIASQRRSNTAGTYDLSKRGMLGYQDWYCLIMKECLRVLKPGGHLLSFGGSRTEHRMVCAIEDAGFEIRDKICWIFGQGFPKSLNIGKAVDKLQGNDREYVGKKTTPSGQKYPEGYEKNSEIFDRASAELTKGTSEWEGWGTALKPAVEYICMARKPLSEKTVALNCLKWGTGGINIDESRVDMTKNEIEINYRQGNGKLRDGFVKTKAPEYNPQLGRFPANLITDGSEEVRECFPENCGGNGCKSGGFDWTKSGKNMGLNLPRDKGNASRFFKSIIYTAKASKSERNKGCEGLEEKFTLKQNTPPEIIEEIKHLLSI